MTSAREIFGQAKQAVRIKRQLIDKLEMLRTREGLKTQRYGERVKSSKNMDSMRLTDERMEAEKQVAAQIETLDAYIADAQQLCNGVRKAYPLTMWADILERYYINDELYSTMAISMYVNPRTVQRYRDAALDYIDTVGLAAAREGIPIKAS